MPRLLDGSLSRRHFLRRLGLAAGATLGTSPLAELAAVAAPAPLHVVITGAGLAGLCAASSSSAAAILAPFSRRRRVHGDLIS